MNMLPFRLAVLRGAALLLLVVQALAPARAAPYVPTDGKQVVEHLPARTDPVQRELARLRAALAAAPDDLPRAVTLARRYIEEARAQGDPRYLGYAEAALAPWYKQPAPPTEVLVLRATLRQSTHRFPAALADLDAVLQRSTDNAQAWLTRATVLTVTGDYAGARASCMRLYSRAPGLIVRTCLANVDSLSGRAGPGYAALKGALERDPDASPEIRLWVLTELAEMAARRGDPAAAEHFYRQALAMREPDSYLLGSYADFLLDRGRAREVVRLLNDKTRVDPLLLRFALALKQLNDPAAAVQAAVLQSRFEAAMQRGDTVHLREHARFELSLRDNPKAAVRLAKLDWAVQKEPADLRILLESAAAGRDPEATRLALDWVARTGIEDRSLDATIRQLKGIR
jgi:Tfp pilus assembly protein PilF